MEGEPGRGGAPESSSLVAAVDYRSHLWGTWGTVGERFEKTSKFTVFSQFKFFGISHLTSGTAMFMFVSQTTKETKNAPLKSQNVRRRAS